MSIYILVVMAVATAAALGQSVVALVNNDGTKFAAEIVGVIMFGIGLAFSIAVL